MGGNNLAVLSDEEVRQKIEVLTKHNISARPAIDRLKYCIKEL